MPLVRITDIISHRLAWGEMDKGNRIMVENGDLFLNETCEVIINRDIAIPLQFHYELSNLLKQYGDEDKLIDNSYLKETIKSQPYRRVYEINNQFCFPSHNCKFLLELIYENDLFKNCKLKVSKTAHVSTSRAIVFGPDFESALMKCIHTGKELSHYYCEHKKSFEENGVFADFLIRITSLKNGEKQMDAWQAIGTETRLYYAHGIINETGASLSHLDFAYHHTTINQIKELVQKKKLRPKLDSKEKIICVNDISFNFAFSLMKTFFPLDVLVEEYQSH